MQLLQISLWVHLSTQTQGVWSWFTNCPGDREESVSHLFIMAVCSAQCSAWHQAQPAAVGGDVDLPYFSAWRWATSHIWLLCWMLKSLQADIFSTGLCCMFCVLTEGWISIKSVQLMGSAMLSAEWSPQTFACLNVLYRYNKDIHLGGGLAVPLEISRQIFMQISTKRCYLHLLTCCPPLLLLAITQTNTISKNLVSEHKHFQLYWYSCIAETFIIWLNNSSCS